MKKKFGKVFGLEGLGGRNFPKMENPYKALAVYVLCILCCVCVVHVLCMCCVCVVYVSCVEGFFGKIAVSLFSNEIFSNYSF